jgi:hypothetical protein
LFGALKARQMDSIQPANICARFHRATIINRRDPDVSRLTTFVSRPCRETPKFVSRRCREIKI